MRKTDYLQKIYEKNPETGHYIIEVSLDKYTDIFNDWDHSSIAKRDLDPDLSSFFESCSADIPLKYGIDFYFYISKDTYSKEIEDKIRLKLKNYYSFYLRSRERTLHENYKKTLGYILTSFLSLSSSIFLETMLPQNIFYKTLTTGLNIGGWVFLWESISFFFFRRMKIYNKAKEYLRFTKASIYFKYEARFK